MELIADSLPRAAQYLDSRDNGLSGERRGYETSDYKWLDIIE